jgi:hypothetical protein
MLDRLNALTILQIIAFGFFFALGWSALARLWTAMGERWQLIAAVVVLVFVLVAVVLVYGGRET